MNKRKVYLYVAVAALLLGAVAVANFSLTAPRDLAVPVMVTGTRALADGGSMEVTLRGANGRTLTIIRRGSLEVERAKQSMYFDDLLIGVVPFRRSIDKRGAEAKEAQALLESWVETKLTAEQRASILANDPNTLKAVPLDVVIAFDMARWMSQDLQSK